jgi:transposase
LGARLEALALPRGARAKIWIMDEARFGLHTQRRKVWITKGTRPEVSHQIRYQWDYLYGALEVVAGQAQFLHLPTVNLTCNHLFLNHLQKTDPEARHIVIADQAGFHLHPGDPRLPERVHILPLPPYRPELNPCEQLWDVLKDTEGYANGLFTHVDQLRKALLPGLRRYWQDPNLVLSLVGRPWLHLQANSSSKI